MSRIKVGISYLQPGWEIILNQEGIPFEVVLLEKSVSIEDYSSIIISNRLDKEQEQIIKQYQKEGGSVLRLAKDIKHSTKQKRFLIAQNDSIFSDIGIVDINGKLYIPNEGTLFYKDLQIFSDKIGKGNCLILPFDVNKTILNTDKKRKRFIADRKELPSEIVTKISKNKIRQIVRISLEYLHHQQNLPFVQKWYYPSGKKNVFIFRIDTDFCSAENANKLLQICKKNNIKGCWFVDTYFEKKLSETYAKMKEQEVGLHCYRHLVFDDYKQNYENIKMGMMQLEKVGMYRTGYVAPFGDWNVNFGKVLDDFEFDY
ncbi:MAG: hypothetical protein KAH01_02445, partial [Caldisericia bacterium]|nr:hypothetical protein [Caldisericia bacterium]